MRLKITQAAKNTHSKLVVDVGWAGAELYSVADDKQIVRHRVDGTVIGDDVKQNARAGAAAAAAAAGAGGDGAGKMDLGDVYATCFHWLAGGNNTFEVFALGCSSGAIRLMTRSGRIEREIKDAHSGAVTAIRWNDDGSGFISGGEDGLLKHWSRNGNLRSKLASSDRAIYACVWSPDAQSVLYASGQYVCVLPAQPSNNAKPIKWKAHDATVLKVDWNAINNLIVTGGEDKKYRLWDSYGRQLFSSKTQEYAVTSVRWAPNGNYFAVGSYDTIALCDKTGWTHSRETCKSGSILALDWTSDGTHVAGAGATGAVCFGQLVERSLEWKNYEITLTEANQVIVTDIASDAGGQGDEFEFGGGRVIDMSLNWNHLIVCTDKKCYIYMLQNLSTPQVMDLVGGGTVNLILQCPQYFALVDNVRGIQVFTYEGKAVSNPKLASLKPQLLRAGNIALSNDHIAVIDRNNPKQIHLLDTLSGRAMDQPIKHNLDIVELALNQTQSVTDRKLFFIDRNRDLFITAAIRPTPFKLATMADTAMWNDTSDILAAVSDSKLLVWYCPVAAFIDKDLLHYTRSQTDATSFGKNSQLITFYDTRLQVRKSDGATQTASINPVPSYLIRYCTTGQWQKAVRLCRWSPTGAGHGGGGGGAAGRDDVLWSTLAVLSIVNGQLDTAEVALAALDEVDKLQFIQQVKAVPTPEGRNAELLLYQRKHDAAESALLQAKLIYRAIQLNIRIFRWARALDLAVQHKTHIDTVLHYRARYLAAAGGDKETDKRFAQFAADVKVDPKVVAEKEAAERDAEEKRGTPYKAVADTKVDVKAEPEPSAFANTISSPKNAAADSPSNGAAAAAAGSGSTPSVSRTASVSKTPAKKADTDVKVAPRQHKKGTRIDIDND